MEHQLEERFMTPGDDLADAFAVRIEVFCREQGYTPDMELDEIDGMADHLVLYDDGTPVATARLYEIHEGVYGIGRVAVVRSWRGRGIGGLLLSSLIGRAREKGASSLQLDAQCRVTGFYEKWGFETFGEEHMDGHIPHKKMKKLL